MTDSILTQHPKSNNHIPGEAGLWLFILGDMLVFSVFFVVLLMYRSDDIAVFTASQDKLNQVFGFINTILMLTSSWCVAMAVQSARRDRGKRVTILLSLAVACGVAFGVVKFLEWGEKIDNGITLITNDFFMFYFIFTGIHFLHVLIGMGALIVLTRYISSGPINASKIRNLECGATFWHLVDLLWIILFALFYLVR